MKADLTVIDPPKKYAKVIIFQIYLLVQLRISSSNPLEIWGEIFNILFSILIGN